MALARGEKDEVTDTHSLPPVALGLLQIHRVEGYSLNGVQILFSVIRYPTEYVDVQTALRVASISKRATGVVVSALDNISELVPLVLIRVEQFSLDMGLLNIFP